MRGRPVDFRNSERRKTRFPASISYGASPTPIPCVLWDVSEGGARITAAHSNILPDTFTLILNQTGKTHFCRVVWRRTPHIGIEFIEATEVVVAPRVQPVDPNHSGYGILAPKD
ncbi:MAG TPA: PilZ domain-containing protein [Xanthobacteraceae bacterium]